MRSPSRQVLRNRGSGKKTRNLKHHLPQILKVTSNVSRSRNGRRVLVRKNQSLKSKRLTRKETIILLRMKAVLRGRERLGRTSCVCTVTRAFPCRGTGRARTRRSTSPTSCPTSRTRSTLTSRTVFGVISAVTRNAATRPARRITSCNTWPSSMTSGTSGSTGG